MATAKKTSSYNKGNISIPLVIVNPKSAGGATKTRWAETASDFRAHFGAFEVKFTRAAGDGIGLAEEAARGERKFIIACGGDGTINEVANGILQSGRDVELGILPSGTGGDFRRTLNISNTSRDAAKELREGLTKTIDVGKVTFFNHKDVETSRYFLNVSSFGLSASINERVKATNLFGWLPGETFRGRAKFALSTLREVLDSEFTTVRVRLDDHDEKLLNTINFCVANSRYFGGGMKIAPDARLDDGFFDVVNIGEIKTSKILLNAYKLYNGSHLSLDEVKHKNAKRIEVRPANEQQTVFIETDGELPGRLPAVYEIVPNALKVRVPRSS
ncbi:MAG: diacylglycerol kinase family lipid kinase [Acidobacteriota bacterium]|nr:diacylglycerol kinase family lipid kinase [Acidobacteriota bacterium]